MDFDLYGSCDARLAEMEAHILRALLQKENARKAWAIARALRVKAPP